MTLHNVLATHRSVIRVRMRAGAGRNMKAFQRECVPVACVCAGATRCESGMTNDDEDKCTVIADLQNSNRIN